MTDAAGDMTATQPISIINESLKKLIQVHLRREKEESRKNTLEKRRREVEMLAQNQEDLLQEAQLIGSNN